MACVIFGTTVIELNAADCEHTNLKNYTYTTN